MKARRFTSLASAAALLAALLALGAGVPSAALAQTPAPDPSWAALTPQQRSVLAPLQQDWHELGPQRRAKWLEIANRYPQMAPTAQQRMQQRMTEWSRMSPEQRSEARANYQSTRELPRRDRQAEWEAYRALPNEEREALAARARGGTPQVNASPLPRQANPLEAQRPKSNLVPDPSQRPPRPVYPSLVQGNPGATTRLLTTPSAPPAHQQQLGLPKITAGPGMVDRTTLLPKRGPQGAGVRGAPASSPKKSPHK